MSILSSELSSNEDGISFKDSKKVQKRKLSADVGNGHKIEQKLDKKKCSLPHQSSSSKNRIIKPTLVVKNPVISSVSDSNENVFQDFVKTCLERRDDEDTKRIIKKLQALYNKLSSIHKNDNVFRLYIIACQKKITQGLSTNIYTSMLDLYKEMKNRTQRKLVEETKSNAGDIDEKIELPKANTTKIELLENKIIECLEKIKELEETEVDFEEDADSAYIKEGRYKKKLIQLCHHLSKLSGDKTIRKEMLKKKITRKDITGEMTGIPSIDETILNFVNSNIKTINKLKYLHNEEYAEHLNMPNYLNVLQCIQKCNRENNCGLSEERMTKLACKAFEAIGNCIKKRRIYESRYYIQSLSDGDKDPAEEDVELHEKLQNNRKEGMNRLEEVFKKFVDKQHEEGSKTDTDNGNSRKNLSVDEESNKVNDKENDLQKNKLYKRENKILIEENLANFEEITVVNDDLIILNNTDDSDNSMEVDPLDTDQEFESNLPTEETVAEPTKILNSDLTNCQPVPQIVTSETKASYDVPKAEKLVDVAKADDVNKVESTYVKVCEFAKSPSAWLAKSPEEKDPTEEVQLREKIQNTRKEGMNRLEEITAVNDDVIILSDSNDSDRSVEVDPLF